MKWIIFDAWGVTYTSSDDIAELMLPYLQQRNPAITYEQIRAVYWPACMGEITPLEFWTALGFADQYPAIEHDYLSVGPRLDPEFLAVAESFLGRYGMAMLSNDVRDWSAFLRRRFGLERFLHTAVISGEIVGVRKPDRQMFDMLLERIGASPAECVLIDDRPKNIRGAAELGFRTIRFLRETHPDEFPADLTIRRLAELPAAVERLLA